MTQIHLRNMYTYTSQTAARILNIFAYKDHAFMVNFHSYIQGCIIVHTRKLVRAGYREGIVRQTDTGALQCLSDNRSTVFGRELTHLFA